jgi:superfamily I DNA/RNA helicase
MYNMYGWRGKKTFGIEQNQKKTCRTNVMYLSEHYMKTSCMINAMDKKQRV